MKETIRKVCARIEKEEDIQILFAIENGSRAWGMESKDSDYDVRFVYKRPLKEYITISPRAEVIKKAYDKEGIQMSEEGCFIDMVGFDIHKFLRMLASSNPTVVEWLSTDILYFGNRNKLLMSYAQENTKRISLYHHYKSMCRQNYLKYLKSRNLVTYKKYLYAMRGLVNAKWIAYDNSLPLINFEATISLFEEDTIIPKYVSDKLFDIIKLKREGNEKDIIKNIPQIDKYIENFLKNDDDAPEGKKMNTDTVLIEELRRIFKLEPSHKPKKEKEI